MVRASSKAPACHWTQGEIFVDVGAQSEVVGAEGAGLLEGVLGLAELAVTGPAATEAEVALRGGRSVDEGQALVEGDVDPTQVPGDGGGLDAAVELGSDVAEGRVGLGGLEEGVPGVGEVAGAAADRAEHVEGGGPVGGALREGTEGGVVGVDAVHHGVEEREAVEGLQLDEQVVHHPLHQLPGGVAALLGLRPGADDAHQPHRGDRGQQQRRNGAHPEGRPVTQGPAAQELGGAVVVGADELTGLEATQLRDQLLGAGTGVGVAGHGTGDDGPQVGGELLG